MNSLPPHPSPTFAALSLSSRGPDYVAMHQPQQEEDGLFLDGNLLAHHDDFVFRQEWVERQFQTTLLVKHEQMVGRVNKLFSEQPALQAKVNAALSNQTARDEVRLHGVKLPFPLSERLSCGVRLSLDWIKSTLHHPFDKFHGHQHGWSRLLELGVGLFDLVVLPVTLPLMGLFGLTYGALSGLVGHPHPHHKMGNPPPQDANKPLPR